LLKNVVHIDCGSSLLLENSCFHITATTNKKIRKKKKKIFVLILDNELKLSLNMISFELYTAHLQILIQLDIDGIVNVGYEFVLLKY